jgi:hypothetical protein
MMRIRRRWLAYWVAVTAVSLFRAISLHDAMSGPEPALGDGHGPDPGSAEYISGIEWQNAHADEFAIEAFIGFMLLGLILWAFWRLFRLFYDRVVLRFIPGGL